MRLKRTRSEGTGAYFPPNILIAFEKVRQQSIASFEENRLESVAATQIWAEAMVYLQCSLEE